MAGESVVRKPGEGDAFWMLGGLYEVKATGPENFEPVTDCRVLVTYAPGGIEDFFAEAGEPAQRREVPPPLTEPPDLERLAAIGAKHGMQLTPPSPV